MCSNVIMLAKFWTANKKALKNRLMVSFSILRKNCSYTAAFNWRSFHYLKITKKSPPFINILFFFCCSFCILHAYSLGELRELKINFEKSWITLVIRNDDSPSRACKLNIFDRRWSVRKWQLMGERRVERNTARKTHLKRAATR